MTCITFLRIGLCPPHFFRSRDASVGGCRRQVPNFNSFWFTPYLLGVHSCIALNGIFSGELAFPEVVSNFGCFLEVGAFWGASSMVFPAGGTLPCFWITLPVGVPFITAFWAELCTSAGHGAMPISLAPIASYWRRRGLCDPGYQILEGYYFWDVSGEGYGEF